MSDKKLPWSIDKYGTVVDAGGRSTVVAQGFALSGRPEAVENAAFIVRACNSHDQLVAALKRFVAYGKTFGYRQQDGCPIEQALEALAAAGEQS